MIPSKAIVRTVAALAALALLPSCASAGGRDREDGPEGGSTGPDPYATPMVTPTPVTPAPAAPAPAGRPVENGNGGLPLNPSNTTPDAPSVLGMATMGGNGQSTERYRKTDVTRDGQNYYLMANGWGPGFQSQSISWSGTSFTVESMAGTQGPNYEPASYPTVFCGLYSDSQSRACGLPAALDTMTSLRTGWSWRANNNIGEYNAAYDIWLGTSAARSSFSGYLMVWFREPPGQQPAGRLTTSDVTVEHVPGTWDIWTGAVGGRPIINWVRAEGEDTPSMEFDILDFVRDAEARQLTVPGSHVLSVAVGFEIWKGPIQDLESVDFYVDVE